MVGRFRRRFATYFAPLTDSASAATQFNEALSGSNSQTDQQCERLMPLDLIPSITSTKRSICENKTNIYMAKGAIEGPAQESAIVVCHVPMISHVRGEVMEERPPWHELKKCSFQYEHFGLANAVLSSAHHLKFEALNIHFYQIWHRHFSLRHKGI